VADQKLSIDPSVAPCSFSGASVDVTGLSVAECGELEYPSADQSPFIHEQPNPSGGEMCPGCTMVNNLDTFAMRIAFNTLVSAEGGPSLFVQKTKPTGFENAFLEVITPTFNRYYALPPLPQAHVTYMISVPDLSSIDPETDRARIVFLNKADEVIFASEVFITDKVSTKLAGLPGGIPWR